MNCAEVENYLHTHIPLSKDMRVSVVSIDENGVRLSAPLMPNINHRSTVFGGSISALAILSAWTLVHVRLRTLPFACQIVIQNNTINYLSPIVSDFQAYCPVPSKKDWEKFVITLTKRAKGRIGLNAQIVSSNLIAGTFQGEYVAIKIPVDDA